MTYRQTHFARQRATTQIAKPARGNGEVYQLSYPVSELKITLKI